MSELPVALTFVQSYSCTERTPTGKEHSTRVLLFEVQLSQDLQPLLLSAGDLQSMEPESRALAARPSSSRNILHCQKIIKPGQLTGMPLEQGDERATVAKLRREAPIPAPISATR